MFQFTKKQLPEKCMDFVEIINFTPTKITFMPSKYSVRKMFFIAYGTVENPTKIHFDDELTTSFMVKGNLLESESIVSNIYNHI